MQVNEVPEPWASAMTAKDFTHGQRPSIRALSRAAGIGSAETVRQMIYGVRAPDPDTVERVASALGISPVEVSRWVQQERSTRKPFRLPAEVVFLTEPEQDAVSTLIKAIAKGRRPAKQRGEGGGHDSEVATNGRGPVRSHDGHAEAEPEDEGLPRAARTHRSPPRRKSHDP